MKTNKYFLFNVLTLLCITYQMNAQPFYYYNDTTSLEKFWRVNLQNGNKDLFFKDSINPGGEITWDPTQTWVFINGSRGGRNETYFSLFTIKANDATITHIFPDQNDPENNGRQSFTQDYWDRIRQGQRVCDGIVYNPIRNVFYVSRTTDFIAADSTGMWNNFLNYQKTAVYDALTFTLLETLPVSAGWITSISSVSNDGNYMYLENWDYQKAKAVGKYSLLTKQLIINRDLSDIVVQGGFKDIDDSKKGQYLIQYLYPSLNLTDKKYAVYDIDRDTTLAIIPFLPVSNGSISSDGKYVIIEETPLRPDYQTAPDEFFHPGRISVFNGKTGALLQKLTLPPDGKVLVFDNYPNMLYYYLESEQRSINIDLSKLSPPSGVNVKLVSSNGAKLTGGALQYYEGSWKDATNNNDGTFFVNTTARTLSLRMTYEFGTQTKSNITVGYDTVVFQTVNAQIQLQNSSGTPMDTGSAQYYAGAWRNLGTTISGVATKELLSGNYSFRMTYAYASKDKQQDLSANSTVIFQTVNTVVQLQNSQGNFIDQGTVQYYSGAWRDFGITASGIASKELLPNNYSFRMNYAYASKDKQQDLSINPIVVFQTVKATVQLQNSLGSLIDQGTVQYYSGAWRTFGSTTNGIAVKELLPNTYSFRMTYEYVSLDKSQDVSTNNTVSFANVLCTIRAKDAQSQPVNNAQASYYSGAWRVIGATVDGQITKEFLPVSLTFRISYNNKQQDKTQNLSTNNIVDFTIQ